MCRARSFQKINATFPDADNMRRNTNNAADGRLEKDAKTVRRRYQYPWGYRRTMLRRVRSAASKGYFEARLQICPWCELGHLYDAERTYRKYVLHPLRAELEPVGYQVRLHWKTEMRERQCCGATPSPTLNLLVLKVSWNKA